MSFGRDTDIGYATPEDTVATILVRLETLFTDGIKTLPVSPSGVDLDAFIHKMQESLDELKRIRVTEEKILGQEVEVEEAG